MHSRKHEKISRKTSQQIDELSVRFFSWLFGSYTVEYTKEMRISFYFFPLTSSSSPSLFRCSKCCLGDIETFPLQPFFANLYKGFIKKYLKSREPTEVISEENDDEAKFRVIAYNTTADERWLTPSRNSPSLTSLFTQLIFDSTSRISATFV